MKRKTERKEIAMNISECSYLMRLCNRIGYKRNFINGKEGYLAVKVSSPNPFTQQDIDMIKKNFKKAYKSNLLFKRSNDKNVITYNGYFSKIESAV